MFTANIKSKSFTGGTFQVVIEYANGADVFSEAENITSEEELNSRIEKRIKTLDGLQALATKLTPGQWQKPTKAEPTPDPIQEALSAVYNAKSKLEMGLVTQAEYDAMVLTYKTLASGGGK